MAADPAPEATNGAPDALDALEAVVRHLGDELAFFRRRALDAERRVKDLLAQQLAAAERAQQARAPGRDEPPSLPADLTRIAALEGENEQLRVRLAEAAERARAVASRLRFARQQDDAAAAVEGVQ